jgi:hypothetical protein
MNKKIEPSISIQFVDGTTESYEFDEPQFDPLTFAAKLEKAVSCHEITLQLADRLRIIPKHALKSIEFKFAPSANMKLPEFTFCNARLISGT